MVIDAKKYRFITIRQEDDEMFCNKPVYRILNNKNDAQLGILSWYTPWRQFVFSSQPECVFNKACLLDVIDFIDYATESEKRSARRGECRTKRK